MRWSGTRILTVSLAAVLALSGCGATGGDGDASTEPTRIASIGLGDVDTLLALGITPVAVAPWSPDSVGAVGEWAQPLLGAATPTLIRDTGTDLSGAAIEAIAATRPDLIMAVNSGYDDGVYDKLEEIAPVVRRPAGFKPWTVPWQDQVTAIAAGVDRPADGAKLISETLAEIEATRAKYPQFAGRSAAVVLPKSDGSLYAYTADDGRGQVLDMLGFEIPPKVAELAGTNFYALIPSENLQVLDVNTMVYLDYGVQVGESAAFDALPAVRENRLVKVNRSLGNAMSMPNPLTLRWVMQVLPPMLPR